MAKCIKDMEKIKQRKKYDTSNRGLSGDIKTQELFLRMCCDTINENKQKIKKANRDIIYYIDKKMEYEMEIKKLKEKLTEQLKKKENSGK